jgi:nicotinate-nucleotide pyrophosphorylase (carboxylating)
MPEHVQPFAFAEWRKGDASLNPDALPEGLERLLALALDEDIGDGDHSALSTIPALAEGRARLLVKDEGILAGVELAQAIFHRVDPQLELDIRLTDGARIRHGDEAFFVSGPTRSILTAERLVLNFMQRMSGIATLVRGYADAIAHTSCRLLDTRKTTPGLRFVEKWAVQIGGGHNHRMGLYDMVMIKDNHVDFCGGIPQAIDAVHAYFDRLGRRLPIEIETRNLDEVEQVLARGGVQRIMLDNFPLEQLRQAVERIGEAYETEASGGITMETLVPVAEAGVDYVSVGALTHSVRSLDLSLKAL